MLAIRMQRTGRKGHAHFRVVVQDSRQAPTSGRVVALLGNYDPHTKAVTLDKEKAALYLKNGAQPSDKAARLFKKEGITLPDWVTLSTEIKRDTRNPEKLRKNRPEEPKAEEPAAEEPATEEVAAEEPAVEAEESAAPEAEESEAKAE